MRRNAFWLRQHREQEKRDAEARKDAKRQRDAEKLQQREAERERLAAQRRRERAEEADEWSKRFVIVGEGSLRAEARAPPDVVKLAEAHEPIAVADLAVLVQQPVGAVRAELAVAIACGDLPGLLVGDTYRRAPTMPADAPALLLRGELHGAQ
eukprot:gnl/Chilomastix_cuspidata/5385.p3 GENE.gnl/Chilomastix_cuspidata/5385~~gnl/Chilomastix_cuspidata/5385.p3  ORF type:complete len:153 (+),score=74.56 gnl/Chilomastix_cuspidata/5385:215-673(+)